VTIIRNMDASLTATIIWRAEDGHQGAIIPELIPVLHHHVRSTDQIHIIPHQKLIDDGFAKAIANTSLVVLPVQRGIRGV